MSVRFHISSLALLLVAVAPALYAQKLVVPAHPGVSPAEGPGFAAPQVGGDEDWDPRFGHPSLRYTAYAMAVAPNGDLYVGGTFREIGGIPANNVARWDGQRWHALGAGIENGGGYVYALAFGPDGALYVAGYFAQAGTARANSVARWDGAAWSAVGAGLSNGQYKATVYALAWGGDGKLYAGGDFTSSGQTAIKKLARLNGATWEDLGAGLGRQNYDGTFAPDGPGEIRALAARGTDVFVGGRFDAVAEGRANSLARFDTQTGTFHTVGGGVGTAGTWESAGQVLTLAAEPGRLCVGGRFDRVGLLAATNAPANNVACWDGTAWQTLGDGIQNTYGAQVNGVGFAAGNLVVTGSFGTAGGQQARHVARWDGAVWHEVGGGLGGDGNALTPDGQGGFFVTGGFDKVGDNFGGLRVAHWTGQQWKALGQGLSSSTIGGRGRALAVQGGLVYVAGGHTHAGGVPANKIAAWNGAAWQRLGAGLGTEYDDAYAAAIGPDGALYVGGKFTTADGQTANRVARWNAATKSWSALGNGVNGAVLALAFAPNGDLYAGGEFTTAGNVEAKYVARWDGQQWSAVGGGMDSYVHALAVGPDGRVYAGGWFDKAGGNPANRIAIWNGTNWSALGGGLGQGFSNRVYAITLVGNTVYVGGNFDATATTAAAGIARWEQATGWSALGTGLGGGEQDVYALAVRGDEVYVGGNFLTAGGQAAGSVARWNAAAQAWSTLGSGVAGDYNSVEALALGGNTLYVAGRFATAGGAPASGFAAYALGGAAAQAQLELDPLTVNFGDQAVGTTADLMVSIGNAAGATAALTGTVSLPAGTPFSIVQGAGAFSVAPGGVREVVVRFSPQVAGAAAATLIIQHNAAGAASPAQVMLTGTGTSRGGNTIVLRHFDPSGPQVTPGAQTGGFVFGTNGYKDRAKGTAFTVPLGKAAGAVAVSAVRVWFSYADPVPGAATYTLHLYNGTAQSGPTGAPLYSKTYRVADANADEDLNTAAVPTVHRVDPPVAVTPGSSFFAVVDFGTYTTNNLLAIAAGPEVQQRVPEVWEQFDTGAWTNVSDSWKQGSAGWQMWMEAELATPTPNESVETPLSLTLATAAPNPAREVATVSYTLDQAGAVVLDVYDLTGRRVATLVDAARPAGLHAATLDARGLAAGTYLIRLVSGSRTRTQPFVVVR